MSIATTAPPETADRVLSPPETVAPKTHPAEASRIPPLPPAQPQHRRPLRTALRWLVFAVLAAAAWYFQPYWRPWVASHLSGGAAAPARPPARPVPVTTAVTERKDLPVYLTGLGTVTALNTVTVRSRVDGELVNVAYTEGQRVRRGDLLAEIDPRPYQALLDEARGQLARDEATLDLARLNLTRLEGLLRTKATTRQVYDEQLATVKQNEAAVRVSQAAVEDAEVRLGYCRVTAPIDGRVGLRLVDRGNVVRAADQTGIVVITQLEPIALVFTVPQDDIPRVQKRMRETANPPVEAFDRGFRTKLAEGVLSAIDNQVDPATGTLRLKATFENEGRELFPNQFVNARLLVDRLENAVTVPSEAIQRGPDDMFVYVVTKDETVELRTVTAGPEESGLTAVLTGLEPGETVVTGGLDKLQPGAKVSTGAGQGQGKGRADAAPAKAPAGAPARGGAGNGRA
jgi:multidrug efflux system membrane fusion protein